MKKNRFAETLRPRLEQTRLELLALFRALDQLDLLPREIPQMLLRELFEHDADFAEALWVLDQPPDRFDLRAMVRDTEISLGELQSKREQFLRSLTTRARFSLERECKLVTATLAPGEAYMGIPGRDPDA